MQHNYSEKFQKYFGDRETHFILCRQLHQYGNLERCKLLVHPGTSVYDRVMYITPVP